MLIETTISLVFNIVDPGPVQNSLIGTSLESFKLCILAVAPSTIKVGIASALGAALQRLPPKVALPCIGMPPIIFVESTIE